MNFGKAYTTFIPILIKAVQLSNGPVLELGAGIFSTPLLHWLCAEENRWLLTCERNPEYFTWAKKFQSRTHKIKLIGDWDELKVSTIHWSVIFVDQDIHRDKIAIAFKDSADYIVLHDSNMESHYGYDKVFAHFKYRYDWKYNKPWTTIVSNFKDLKNL